MVDTKLSVLVVDDDFRVANLHRTIVDAVAGFTTTATVNTLAAARQALTVNVFDLALVDVYLPDGSGIDFVREVNFDAMVLSAATDAATIRAALAAGALNYLVKPFPNAALATRLGGYTRYRKILNRGALGPRDVEAALESLRSPLRATKTASATLSPTKKLILQTIRASADPMSADELSTAINVSRATAQRHLTDLVDQGGLTMQLRYGTTGRPTQEYSAAPAKAATGPPRNRGGMHYEE